jgi:hypothetical protein
MFKSVENNGMVLKIKNCINRRKYGKIPGTWKNPWHTLIDNFKTLKYTLMKWSVKERIAHLRYTLSN